ncbi:hypothetical protein [Peterkaempfera sp. SMS 1(5)a]|uniref:hypothetical protein n=1 Tax=Peterkaempfera podocarpi TaxID=3232308 RepID=UPI003673412A
MSADPHSASTNAREQQAIDPSAGGASEPWPTGKLTALRLGRRLVTEVPTSRPGRRAFVDITPGPSAHDAQAQQEGRVHNDAGWSFRVEHWEHDADRIADFDHDIGAVLVRTVSAESESELTSVLSAWQLPSQSFVCPWVSEDPE